VKNRIFFKLVLVFTLVIAAATLTLDVAITHSWRSSLRQQIESNLRQKTAMFASRVAAAPLSAAEVEKVAQDVAETSGARATVIDSQGLVLADSGAVPEKMENHARRPEFQAALAGSIGVDTRNSHTLGVDFLYLAQPIPGGAVRLAVPLSAIAEANRARWSLLPRSPVLLRFCWRPGHPEAPARAWGESSPLPERLRKVTSRRAWRKTKMTKLAASPLPWTPPRASCKPASSSSRTAAVSWRRC
jgi:two-component system phosphate regulon sensor histidine kinase PhoR